MMGVVATMVFMLRRPATDCGLTLGGACAAETDTARCRDVLWRLDRRRQSTLAGGLPTGRWLLPGAPDTRFHHHNIPAGWGCHTMFSASLPVPWDISLEILVHRNATLFVLRKFKFLVNPGPLGNLCLPAVMSETSFQSARPLGRADS